MKLLVTGCAGFIGSSLCDQLLKRGLLLIGIDNFNDYYDPKVKEKNIVNLLKSDRFKLYREDILNYESIKKIFKFERVDKVVHLAARAGVRASILDPDLYAAVNVMGTVNILKVSYDFGVKQFIFGSSSSVYGRSGKLPFTENDLCNEIVSPYGASKRAAEIFVESFNKSFGMKSIILRFFTVYGPRGRVDMAPALFSKAIINGQVINKFGDGSSSRDYTFIDDIVRGITLSLDSNLDFGIINLGNDHPVSLNEFIGILEDLLGKSAKVRELSKSVGDVEKTWANVVKAKELLGWMPKVKLNDGLKIYIEWLKSQNK